MTDYHAQYIAYDLTRQCGSDSVEKFASVLSNSQALIDLNPHQVEAALFAFQNPFSKGAILADEVGLGKTIEAGLLIAQLWAERKRRILVVVPANLRKQWSQELADKFFLPSQILENKTFNETVKKGNLNPFLQDGVVISSYQFVSRMDAYIKQTGWDLVVIDEAHRLRNVYKASSRIANTIKTAVQPFRKVLLTATPLQNSLLELYGLVSIIDDHAFGDLKAYKTRFSRLGNEVDFQELKDRLKPLCKRTLRKQVLEYVKYTNRHALVQEFFPTRDEQDLYDHVSEYLQRDHLYALPSSQRKLMTLILRKLLASSTYAISDTLQGLVKKLELLVADTVDADDPLLPALAENWEEIDELEEEWDEDEVAEPGGQYGPMERSEILKEIALLQGFLTLARSIEKNSKGEVLLTALRKGFAAADSAQKKAGQARVQQKAIIFTESRKTQDYLARILEATEFVGKVVLFNGSNNDTQSKATYQAWLARHKGTDKISGSPTADMRSALVDAFRNEADIMIATEAAAEGINLQFCNLVVNYDLPWNPQRIEQRIGRCHRYGQACDVVVVNFLNKKNDADVRVYQLLAEKFQLFDGVFGASDEVLGVVESGVDFEKRIASIYQKCRTPQQIQFEFDLLQKDMDQEIEETQNDAREKLLDNFDQDVVERVKIQSRGYLDRYTERLWSLVRHRLADVAQFNEKAHSFSLTKNPFPQLSINLGPYSLGKGTDEANLFRVGHPLAQALLADVKAWDLGSREIVFDYSASGKNIAVLKEWVGQSGWLSCTFVSMKSLDTEEALILSGITDDGATLDEATLRRLFDLPGSCGASVPCPPDTALRLQDQTGQRVAERIAEASEKNGVWFDTEMEKLDHWAEDRRTALKVELDDLDQEIKDLKKAARQASNLPEKLEKQKKLRSLEAKRDEAWRAFDVAKHEIEKQKDQILDDIGRRLEQQMTKRTLFTVRWSVN